MSDLDILRRIAERGLAQAQNRKDDYVDLFQHMLDEISRIEPTKLQPKQTIVREGERQMTREEMIALHKHSVNHYDNLALLGEGSCFYCLHSFTIDKIKEYIDSQEPGDRVTALCPYCGIDAVLPGKQYRKVLEQMNNFWFGV